MKLFAMALIASPGAALAHGTGATHHHGYEVTLTVLAVCLTAGALLWSNARQNKR